MTTQPKYVGWDVPRSIDAIVDGKPTILPVVDEAGNRLLDIRSGVTDTDTDTAYWIEFHKDGVLVHRSVHSVLKKLPQGMEALKGKFT